MKRAMAKQAEAERERRAKVIHAEGEYQAAERLADAARLMVQSPGTLQLRYLQTLAEIAVEQNSTILFPMPIEVLTPILKALENATERGAAGGETTSGTPGSSVTR
jgi:regulator of protease activity HflC (stomatin/prohibitin superfamily)